MKKIINKVCSTFLTLTVLFSLAACDNAGSNGGGNGLGDSNGNSNSSSSSVSVAPSGGSNVSMREQIFTDGVHVYDYTETNKYVVENETSDYKIVLSANPSKYETLAADRKSVV